MGNSLGCSASGERLVSAARDGDLVEAKMLLDLNPSLARYSTFGGLNTPLHLAAAKGHSEIVQLLLKNGASVDSRNYCGQTPLMQACRSGHWEVVQSLVLYRCNVGRADYLTGRTALHFAAIDGHTRCLRLVLSDHTPFSSAQESPPLSQESCDQSEVSTLSRLVNRASDGGITALHMAAVNGQFECVQLLLDFHADINATTYHYGTAVSLIGSGSTPLHYAACGGNLKCCQILLSRGASRLALNCNGWLPLDVARIWRRHQLEQILAPNSKETVPRFPSSNFLSLPLFSILSIAREFGLQSSASALQNNESCAVCLERTCSVAAEGCKHELCIKCAFYLSSSGSTNTDPLSKPGTIPCPLCRHGISHFLKLPTNPAKHSDPSLSLNFCNPCLQLPPTTSTAAMPATMAVPCVTFPSISSARMGPSGPKEEEKEEEEQNDLAQVERMERSICSGMFRGRRSFHREIQCDSELRS